MLVEAGVLVGSQSLIVCVVVSVGITSVGGGTTTVVMESTVGTIFGFLASLSLNAAS